MLNFGNFTTLRSIDHIWSYQKTYAIIYDLIEKRVQFVKGKNIFIKKSILAINN
jgi:hypothetical protein